MLLDWLGGSIQEPGIIGTMLGKIQLRLCFYKLTRTRSPLSPLPFSVLCFYSGAKKLMSDQNHTRTDSTTTDQIERIRKTYMERSLLIYKMLLLRLLTNY